MEDLIAALRDKYSPDFPKMRSEEVWIEEDEKTHEARNGFDYGFDRGTRKITTHYVKFHVPFAGDGSIFHIQPSNRTLPGPSALVNGQELVITVATTNKNGAQVKAEFEQTLRSIEQHLTTLFRDLGNIPAQIEQPARQILTERRNQILKSKDLVASLGFPMKRRPDAPKTYRAPEVRRKLSPVRPETTTPFQPEPELAEAEYQFILEIMDNMTKVMEQSPHTFVKMGEEDIRTHFLVQLNGQYQGQATGETFNYEGKTDIIIKSAGRNIFIAECKIWRGEKVFIETVDQLLSYLSWRDTKASVVIFNRNKNTSGVITTIRAAMENYSHKKRGPTIESETRLRYVLGNPGDTNREIVMTIMVYDIPLDP
ncbi:hypothetical protein CWB41_15960 [Methylovirgula ligni]|uniref:hypothetical protein n=1 Tax=Methylovirgula ligni TaxID=569860 RepID=UPI001011D211|nr:hypothetical protein [Methylovirgula ligni]QAY97046.1 hypothetical protein CWB41_15960 [Methylovirgula ligni]